MSITELTVEELTSIIEDAVERKIIKYFDEHLTDGELRPEIVQLLKQQSRGIDTGEMGKSYDDVLKELGLS